MMRTVSTVTTVVPHRIHSIQLLGPKSSAATATMKAAAASWLCRIQKLRTGPIGRSGEAMAAHVGNRRAFASRRRRDGSLAAEIRNVLGPAGPGRIAAPLARARGHVLAIAHA